MSPPDFVKTKVGKTTVVLRPGLVLLEGRILLSEDESWDGLQVVAMSLAEFGQIAGWVAQQGLDPA